MEAAAVMAMVGAGTMAVPTTPDGSRSKDGFHMPGKRSATKKFVSKDDKKKKRKAQKAARKQSRK